MRVLFCGGGTAGHVMPAIAINEMLKKRFTDYDCAFVGRRDGDENRSISRGGYKLYTLDIMGFKRSLSPRNISALFKLIKSMSEARRIIAEFRPELIIGTGGYVCYPVIKEGQRLGIKTVIHESNVYPGLVTRLLGAKCDKLLLNVEGTQKHLKSTENTEVVGNPLRQDFKGMSKEQARAALGIKKNEFFVVSFGGSLGSEVLNEAVTSLMQGYSSHTLNIRHLHATGRKYYEELSGRYPRFSSQKAKCRIVPYIDNVPEVLRAADLAITRSGAMTISELSALGVASILVPSPNVVANHQYMNAKYLADCGAAILIEERELSGARLKDVISNLRSHEAELEKMRRRIASLSDGETEKRITEIINSLI